MTTDDAAREELTTLRSRMAKLEALLGIGPRPGRAPKPPMTSENGAGKPVRRKVVWTAAARRKQSIAAKARWAQLKRDKAATPSVSIKPPRKK